VRFTILLNGSSIGFFSNSRGLRQGDPLSPLLFVIVMEALGSMISIVVSGSLLSDFSVGIRVDISYLLFADDNLIFYGDDTTHLCNLRILFLLFEVESSLKMNLAKSGLVTIGNVDNVATLAWMLGCGVSSLPMKYLGLPLGASYKAKHIWVSIIEKI
jgi:hypothetical protein